ncbi:unnamed protein product, partial [Coregonus sp. 'balchen']
MDQLKVWVHSSNSDVLVITETWLRKSVLNTDVSLSGYNLFCQDRSSKGGGVAIFTKEPLQCSVVSTNGIVNKHAPIKKMRIESRFSPWFDRDLAELLHLKNSIWQKARNTHTQADWLSFRQMRNKCTQAIWKVKVSYFKEQFALCESNPKKFWKTVKDLENKPSSSQLPMSLNADDVVVTRSTWLSSLITTSL